MFRSQLSPLLPALCLLLRVTTSNATEPRQIPPQHARFVGAVGCKSSSCHGGAGEKRSQFMTWTRQDFHARAFAILTNARSTRIAETLSLPSAQSSNRCTVCHSPLQAVPPAHLIASANPTEGVSCESCHGAAEAWLRGHTRTDWKYATRVGAGMRDLRSFYVRANTCVACHQNLDPDIASAGHPELVFEMDRQSVDEPKHWRDPEGTDVRAWLVGQAAALRETSWRLVQNAKADEQTLAEWNALAWLLNKVTESDRTLVPIESPNADNIGRVQQQADALARRAATQTFSADFSRQLSRNLTALDSDFLASDISDPVLFRRARRLLLALESLTSDEKTVADQLAHLRGDLRSPNEFKPAEFAAHLVKLRDLFPSSAH